MAFEKPNIILITTDQQRFDSAGSVAPSFMRTPHFDQLQREGITFGAAYADCPLCVPSRVTIMTGRHAFNHGMMANGRTANVMGREETLPGRMRALGYQTAAIGKMHFGPQRARHGFEEMVLPDDYYRHMGRLGYDLQPMHHGLGQCELYPTMATVTEAKTLTSWTAEQCVEFILERRDPTVPFFLWCSFSKPHPPFDPPEPYYSMYRDCPIPDPVYGDWSSDENVPPRMLRDRRRQSYDVIPVEIIRAARAAYYGLVTQIDYNMGRIFAALQDVGLFRETLFIYTSDHGEFLGDHHTGAKQYYHEPSAHVPFVLRLPKSWENRRHGTTVSIPVTLADILPTIVAAGGGEAPTDLDGIDLTALAREELEISYRYVEGNREDLYCAITDGRWKYIWYPEGGYEHLFDLQTDPRELRNLANQPDYQEKRVALQQEMIDRHFARRSPLVEDGRLVKKPVSDVPAHDSRNLMWGGYHTEYYPHDVRH